MKFQNPTASGLKNYASIFDPYLNWFYIILIFCRGWRFIEFWFWACPWLASQWGRARVWTWFDFSRNFVNFSSRVGMDVVERTLRHFFDFLHRVRSELDAFLQILIFLISSLKLTEKKFRTGLRQLKVKLSHRRVLSLKTI